MDVTNQQRSFSEKIQIFNWNNTEKSSDYLIKQKLSATVNNKEYSKLSASEKRRIDFVFTKIRGIIG